MQEAIQELVDKLYTWFIDLVTLLPNLVIAILVLIAALLMARMVQRTVHRGMKHVSDHPQVNRLAATIGRLIVIAVGLFIALSVIGLDGAVATLLAGAGIVGLALGFAFQDIAANFISGILLSIRRPFRGGDLIETNEHMGYVYELNLRSTYVRTLQGPLVVIPNKEVLQNPLVNYSRLGHRRIDLECGVAYGDDLEHAKQVALEAINAIPYLADDQPVDFYYTAFGDSSIDFVIRYWVDFSKQTDYLEARSEGVERLKKAFDEAGISIPFPIRTLDFGVVGGEKLSDVWPR